MLKGIAEEEGNDAQATSNNHLRLTCSIIAKHVKNLNAIIKELERGKDDGRWQLGRKAAKSLRREPQITEISNALDRISWDLTLGSVQKLTSLVAGHQCLSQSTEPIARLPLAPFYGLPPRHLSRLLGREETLSELKKKLMDNPAKICPINLWGLNG